jgi:hypothetical protein
MQLDFFCTACDSAVTHSSEYGFYANPQDAESWTCECGARAGPEGHWITIEDALAQGLCVPDPGDQFDAKGRPFPKRINEGSFPVLLPDGERVLSSEQNIRNIQDHLRAGGTLPGMPPGTIVEEAYVGDVKVWPEPTPPGASEMDDDAKRKAEAERVAKAMGW